MTILLSGGQVFMKDRFRFSDIVLSEGRIFISSSEFHKKHPDTRIVDVSGKYIFPGFTDVHVHLREPGFSYKETIATGAAAAAAGGYTTVAAMPNVSPPPDSPEGVQRILDIARTADGADVVTYGTITEGRRGERIAPLEKMNEAVAFSDDGSGIQSEALMREAMTRAAAIGKIIAAHCEVNELLHGGYIHDGTYAAQHGHRGISSESEWRQIERDVRLAEETGAKYHVCHVSTKEGVDIIRKAKARGVDVTAETAPHYLVLDDSMLCEDGAFKMNPPLRDASDRLALIEGLCDGTIDMIATDHAPHSAEEKSHGLEGSLMGVVGLECAFPVLYTSLVIPGKVPLARLIDAMATSPARRFGIWDGEICDGGRADIAVIDPDAEYRIDPEKFRSMGRSTPFAGMPVRGRCIMTIKKGNVIYDEQN